MIGQSNRFHGHKSVSRVSGSVVYSQYFSVRHAQNNKPDYRLAIVVSKKTAPKAVTRNRIRRRLYELVRKQNSLNGKQIDVVIYVKDSIVATMPAGELQQLLSESIQKITPTIT